MIKSLLDSIFEKEKVKDTSNCSLFKLYKNLESLLKMLLL